MIWTLIIASAIAAMAKGEWWAEDFPHEEQSDFRKEDDSALR